MANEMFWKCKVANLFYESPDKLIDIERSEERRNNIFKRFFNGENLEDLLNSEANDISNTMQRFVIPRGRDLIQDKSIKLLIKQPLTGENITELDFIKKLEENREDFYFLSEKNSNLIENASKMIKSFNDDWNKIFMYLWAQMLNIYPFGAILPADSRFPDHSIIDHNDITSAIAGCLYHSNDIGFFTFKLPDVQRFISASRKFSDLWAGSHLMGFITLIALISVIETYGPDVIVFPYLRDDPLLVQYFNKYLFKNEILKINSEINYVTIPNVFLAILPANVEKIERLKEDINDNINHFLKFLIKKLFNNLNLHEASINEDFLHKANKNILKYFEPTTVFIKFPKDFEEFDKITEDLPKDLKNILEKIQILEREEQLHKSNSGIFYNLLYLLSQILIAQKSRLFNDLSIKGKKCNVCGVFEQIITYKQFPDVEENKGFINENESFCILCLIKRFYNSTLAIDMDDGKYQWTKKEYRKKIPSLFEIANTHFEEILDEASNYIPEINKLLSDTELLDIDSWPSQSTRSRLKDKDLSLELIDNILYNKKKSKYVKVRKLLKSFKKYYALLKIDGDHMGKLLGGNNLPKIENIIHPEYLNEIQEFINNNFYGTDNDIDFKRPLTPSYHLTISKAMKYSALNIVPDIIINKYKGELIFSGGDDVFAVLPVENALQAAFEIRKKFSERFYSTENKYVFGLEGCSMSAGIIFSHYKFPLSFAIKNLNSAEKSAKENLDRDAIMLRFIDHSGQITEGGFKWGIEKELNSFISKFVLNPINLDSQDVEYHFSPRFLYELFDTLHTLPEQIYSNEIKRLLKRHFVIEKDPNIKLNNKIVENFKSKQVRETSDLFCEIYKKYKNQNKDLSIWRETFDERFNKSYAFIQNLTNIFLILYKIQSSEVRKIV